MAPHSNITAPIRVRQFASSMSTVVEPVTYILIAIVIFHNAVATARASHELARVASVAAQDLFHMHQNSCVTLIFQSE